jgi:flavin-dependent dehydrogenase
MNQDFDVAVIGGGPAGSTAGTLLARNGRSVVILEKEKFPRFRVGESMLPASSDTLERMGVKEKVDQGGFLIKYGGEICSACGAARARFYFRNGLNAKRHTSYQVERAKFDQILLDHARGTGCDVREQTPVDKFDFDAHGVMIHCNNGSLVVRAKYLLDCSGRNSLIANRFHLKQAYPNLKKFSVFAHYDHVGRPHGQDGTLTRMIRCADGWFWMIPMAEGRASVGVVMDIAKFRAMNLTPEEALKQCIAEQPEVREWMHNARPCTPIYATSDFSYRVKRLTGERWVLAGDAAGFLDPVFSSGVYIAIYSGEKAADTISAVLARPEKRSRAFRLYERAVHQRFDAYFRLTSAWYTKEFVEIFLHPRELCQLVPTVNAVLSGNPARSFGVKWRMCLFYLLVYLQGRSGKLVPQLTFQPKAS